jgi:hypothetical protein
LARAPRPRIKGRKKGGSKEIDGLRRDTTAFPEIRPPIEGKRLFDRTRWDMKSFHYLDAWPPPTNTKRATGSKE